MSSRLSVSPMRVVVAGLGVQGHKRRRFAGADFVAAVDPVNEEARLPDDRGRSARRTTTPSWPASPTSPRSTSSTYCIGNGKHVLVEKPLWAKHESEITALETLARRNGVVCYTAYNHRFEPHFVRMRDLIASGELGAIYRCRMFYGNGTARLVRDSAWRDQGAGVLPDLGSHLLDTCRFWFGDIGDEFRVVGVHRFENRAPDHVVIASRGHAAADRIRDDAADLAQPFHLRHPRRAAARRISSRCANGGRRNSPSARGSCRAAVRRRRAGPWCRTIRPGRSNTRISSSLCSSGAKTDLSSDIWLHRVLQRLSAEAAAAAGAR